MIENLPTDKKIFFTTSYHQLATAHLLGCFESRPIACRKLYQSNCLPENSTRMHSLRKTEVSRPHSLISASGFSAEVCRLAHLPTEQETANLSGRLSRSLWHLL
jgi:hypothetical protein